MSDRTHRENKYPLITNSRTSNLLVEIGNSISDLHFGLARPGLVVRFGINGARKYLHNKEKWSRKQTLKKLRQKKFILENKIADQYYISLTEKGIEEYLRLKSMNANYLPSNQLCVVSFDIPESQKLIRRQIRHLLKRIGFKQMHRSVWTTKKNVSDDLSRLFSIKFKNSDWVKIFHASEI
ncbi:hypothetical protein HN358_03060 [Candidatus Uhrbacteria bacterium]|jgi:hypothetical protein|nr:hypothetical protein [Candidatus Uhrbacteria bacterium]MBT7717180.1 hypothetical protein [Candidatus Uhrbacteria bacterium]